MSCPASDPRPSRRGRSRHRWSCRTSPFPRRECAGRNAPPVCTSSCRDSPEKYDPRNAPKSLLARRRYFRQKRHGYRRRSRRRAIAFLMLAPCSASSMLSAPLRPGPWPGIRALTTPTRGTFQQLCDGRQPVDHSETVDAGIAQAYVDIITSVPHGTPSVRLHGLRRAHSAGAHRARYRAHPPQKSQSDARRPRVVRRRRLSCESRYFSPRVILRITRCAEDAFTSGNISAALTERKRRSNHPRSSPRGA